MTAPIVCSDWFSAAELAALALPGLPRARQKLIERATDERWALRVDGEGRKLCRQRAGRGGGSEYHVAVLPAAARLELVRRGLAKDAGEPAAKPLLSDSGQLWAWFEAQPKTAQAEAHARLRLIDLVEAHERQGLTRQAAVITVSRLEGAGASTLWGWLSLVAGCPVHDRLPRLAPRRRGGGKEAEIDALLWQAFRSDYLRPEAPTMASCHARTAAIAEARGLACPHVKTFQRKLEREVPEEVRVARRKGSEATRQLLPAQQRSVAGLHALELVNIDGHKWDVFVRFPDGQVRRPIMVAIQDVYSRKMLAWRIGDTESAVLTRLAFADLFKSYGIPTACLMDNGRAFASKWITGGTLNRFRFKVREDEPLGLLTALGVKVHWATPYRGQSKPIERGFRDFADAIAKHPAFAGAYTGNKPDAKPENYASAAVPLETFLQVVAAGIAAHNAKLGRRTEMARGGSFDQAFAESYARAPIGRAKPEQLRLALLAADRVRADRTTGAVDFCGNRYWSDALSAHAGQLLTIRFDPDDLHSAIHAYAPDGSFIASVPVWEKTGFLDAGAAKERARLEADHRRKVRAAIDAQELLSAAQLAALLPADPTESDTPSPAVLRPVRVRGNAAAAVAAVPDADPSEPAFIDRFRAARERLRLVDEG